jgi:hypothetical protein
MTTWDELERLPATLDGRRLCRDCARQAVPNFTTCMAHLREAVSVFNPQPAQAVVERLSASMPELQIAGRR